MWLVLFLAEVVGDIAYQPAVVVSSPGVGSLPATGKVAKPMVPLAGMGVASFQMETSLSSVELE